LNGVSFTDANNGTAVGLYGTVLRTTDGGVNWVPQTSEQQTVCLMSPLPIQITERLLVGNMGYAQSSEQQTAEQPGLHNQAEHLVFCMVSPLPMQITGWLLAVR